MTAKTTDTAAATPPTGAAERLESLDVIRGIAVLGILLLNIIGMGLHVSAMQGPGANTDVSTADWLAWFIPATLFEGTFRAIFGMLFAAGIYLFMTRLEQRTSPGRARWLHLKRTFFLMLFGFADMFLLLWYGDILFLYGFIGLFLWLFRRAGYKTLTVWLVIVLLIGAVTRIGGDGPQTAAEMQDRISDLQTSTDAGKALTAEEQKELRGLKLGYAMAVIFDPPEDQKKEEISRIQSGWAGAFDAYLPLTLTLQFALMPLWLLDSLVAMLLGLMLFKSGFLKGESKTATYLAVVVIGYGLALPLRAFMVQSYAASGFDMGVYYDFYIYYDPLRIAIALAHISLVCLLLRFGWLPLRAALAAAGRMALTNYLGQSLLVLVIFIVLGYHSSFTRAELYLLVAVIWAVQLWFSRWWLQSHAQGPAEALWRRMTYGRPATKASSLPHAGE